MVRRRDAFTLLELCLALMIGLMIILLAVPSISGLLAEKRLNKSFDDLGSLIAKARFRSIKEQRVHTLVWEGNSIRLSASTKHSEGEPSADSLVFNEGEHYVLTRPAALDKNPASIWTFWPSGACEPAEIAFEGAAGHWVARYDPLTTDGVLVSSEIR